ncbi:NEDD8 ligase DCN1 KNAG_0G02440 [Huiozyma naganishii CBS 8797]|uniref:Defective in cullin neddylation protein n=1 Tax=Huiozyma naganishii (strain ATCC MYA-139 / BCRC 22969 / CBS 8797 / KCTC 17520 / NBRC 10181 / NCYC 3082 / Yp74L-3) TaxID=1071383 RepID=J7S944_HUIN7|nr:hypothetical protein KNAG_0G02440 [Kazachstania naganishii CBS 8797]CCK71301.1 hypothetical protein KNAG_0G02440 [Kazachstania naganishii CBS 8797]
MEEDAIHDFIELTQCRDRKKAERYLRESHWNVNYALNDFYDKEVGNFFSTYKDVPQDNVVYPPELIHVFDQYSEAGVITFEGMITYIGDLSLSIDDLVTICLAQLLGWENLLAPITREQFLAQWFLQGCSTINEMKTVLADLNGKLEKDRGYFKEIYMYTFPLLVEPDQNKLDAASTIEYWKLFFDQEKKYPMIIDQELLDPWFVYLGEQSENMSVTEDIWKMVYQFFNRFRSLGDVKQGYDEMAAWPILIDEFIEYLQDTVPNF